MSEHGFKQIGINRHNFEHAVRAFGLAWERGSAPAHVRTAVGRVLDGEARRLLADEGQGDAVKSAAGRDSDAVDRETDDLPASGV